MIIKIINFGCKYHLQKNIQVKTTSDKIGICEREKKGDLKKKKIEDENL